MNTPVLFIIFNRPDTAQKVFDGIRHAQPRQLFVAADGPRKHRSDEAEKCARTRDIIQQVDWDCEVKTLFRDENLGCGKAVSLAINWFFEQVEQGIILEDDCVPDPSFFTYCTALLERYRTDLRVWSIGGACFYAHPEMRASYRFSALPPIWGWATWRDRWDKYEFDIRKISGWKLNAALKKYFHNRQMRYYWLWRYGHLKITGKPDTWDYQFTFSLWLNGGLGITPNTNLISNIGFGDDATHCNAKTHKAHFPTSDIGTLVHPSEIKQNTDADDFFHYREKRLLKGYLLVGRYVYLRIKTFLFGK
jgi:hypothetical protein